MEPYLLTMKEGAAIDGHFIAQGDEFAYVIEGDLEV